MHQLRVRLSVHRHTEPNLHHTGGVKGITMGQCKKGKMKQRRNMTRTAQGEIGKRGTRYRGKTEHQSPKLWERICYLFVSVLVCLTGVWWLCLHRPPCRYFFLCKNGCSHDASIFGLIPVRPRESEKASSD